MRVYGSDHYQFLSIWALPLTLKGKALRDASSPLDLIDRNPARERNDNKPGLALNYLILYVY